MTGVSVVSFLIVVVFTCGCMEEEKIKGRDRRNKRGKNNN